MAAVAAGRPASTTRQSRALRLVVSYAALLVLAAVFIAPLLWMGSTSFKNTLEAVSNDPTLLPREPTLVGYDQILRGGTRTETPVLRWFGNSLMAATLHALLVVSVAAAAGYPLAHLQFRGKRLLFGLIIATLFVPPIILLVPNYVIVAELGWLDRLIAVIVPAAGGAFAVFFMRQFMLSIPRELLEAAAIDGANQLQIFRRVVLPLAKPALAVLTVLSFLTNWNEFLWSLFVLLSPEVLTLPPGLQTLQRAFTTDYNLVMVGGMVASVPVLILFIIAQRFIIEGVARSGIKG